MEESRTALATIQGKLTQFVESMPSIAQLEEEVERSEVELSRVKKLDQTLSITLELLKDAQDRVHRTLAPELRDSLKPWLESVSLGRYNDIRVDVKSLSVTVTGDGKSWREANLLSHGTTEQIYLLLRVVMSRFLTSKEEICPLILDDVTVHCDPERHGAILSLLHDISRHQESIFSQEPETLEWAEERLSDSLGDSTHSWYRPSSILEKPVNIDRSKRDIFDTRRFSQFLIDFIRLYVGHKLAH